LQASPTKCYGKSNVSGEDIQNFVSAITKLGYDAAQLATDSSDMDKKQRKISTSDNDDSYPFGVTHKVKKPRNHLESSSQDDSETINSDIDGFINDNTEDSNDDSQDNDDTDNDSDSSDSSGEGSNKHRSHSRKIIQKKDYKSHGKTTNKSLKLN